MRRSSSIASRIREVFLDGHWIANTNYKEQLSGLPWDKAVQNFQGLNSVAALTYHINYYLAGLIVVFKGGGLEIHDKYSFDLPEINSENKWQTLVAELLSNAEEFAQHVDVMTDELLDSSFVDEKYGSYARNIEAVIEHSYYHLGQITLIRKLLKR
jgi:hypothetical protein